MAAHVGVMVVMMRRRFDSVTRSSGGAINAQIGAASREIPTLAYPEISILRPLPTGYPHSAL